MPKNKFNSFYYGIGMKLDEASVDKAGQQLEGRLNKVVDNITQKVAAMSDVIAKGSKNVDMKDLVKSLAEAQKELNQFQNFDPSKLQKQIDSLNSTVASLGTNLGDIGEQLKSFTNDISTRLSNIEIKTSKQGKDALKADLKGIIELARGYRDVMSQGVEVDTSALDKYFLKVKQGFKSLQNSQNPMEMFSDKELAHYFVSFTKILQEMGTPVDKLRSEFYSLSSVFKSTFEKSGASGATSVFKDISYQIEAVSAKIRKAEADLESYEARMAKAQSRTKSTGFDITVDGDKNLNFEQKIARIQEYGDIIAELDYGEEWATATKHQIALIQAAEKELQSALKKTGGQELLDKWKGAFPGFDLTNKMSSDAINEYVDVAQKSLESLKSLHEKTKTELTAYQSDLGKLMAKEAVTTSSKKAKKTTTSTQKQKATGVAAEVDAKIKINQEEWRKVINKAITDVEPKVKPFKIRVEATSGKILEEVKKIRDAALVNKGKDGTSDVNAFNKRFDTFYTNLKKRREEIINELKDNWHPALKDAFSFKFELLGIDKRSLTKDIDTYLISTVDAINDALAQKPIEFHSNIDTLIDEIQSKIENLKLDGNITLGAGNITVNPSSIGNVPLILGNIQPGNVVQSQPISTPEPPKPESKPAEDKKSKRVSKKAQKTGESLEDILDTQFKNGKEIIEYYIGIAKLGKNLNSIREIADKPITADMFNDENLTKWVRGKMYTKDDIGSYAPGKKATPEAVDKFLSTMGITEADLAEANTKEETQFLTPLKKYIYTFMQNRQELNALIKELTEGQGKSGKEIAQGYLSAGNDTTGYLVDEVFNAVKKLYVKDPKTKAQKLVTDTFKNAHIDISAMSSLKTTEDKWNLLQSQLFNRQNYMIGSGDSAVAATWEDFAKIFSAPGLGTNFDKFAALLKIGRQYSTTFNSLSAVGKEADMLIKGRTEEVDKRSRRWNNEIGDYEYTEGKVSQVVQQGVRGMLKNLQAVFENKAGSTLLGYNLGKGYIPDDVFQGAGGSFTQIIKTLTTALERSSQILFGRNMKGLEGNTSVGRYDPPTTRITSGTYKFATQHTEKEQISKWITEINNQKAKLQAELGEINKQYAKLVKPEDKTRVAKLVSEIKTKKESLNKYNDKIVTGKNKVDELKKSLTSPETIYEDIVEKLLQAEENLLHLKQELSTKKKNQKTGTYNKEIEDLQSKISAQETSIKGMISSSEVASRSNADEKANQLIAQEEEKIRVLNEKLAAQKEDQIVKQKQAEISRLRGEQAALAERINVLRGESKQVQDIINKSTNQGAIAAMTVDLQAKTKEIDGLLQQTTAYQNQIGVLQAEIDPHTSEQSFLSKEIEFRKKYVNALKEALKKRKKVRTPESISGEIDSRTNELNKLQAEHDRVESELSALEVELGKFGSLQEVNSVIQKLQSIEEHISQLDAQLAKHKQNLKTADGKKHIYSKTYSQAVNDLPAAQAGRVSARENLVSLVNKYTSERTAIVTDALMQQKLGTLSDGDVKKMQENLHNIDELNKQLQNGAITREEYIKKVSDAYVFMRKAATEEAKATAKVDAEKLANAALLVKKYEEEEAILKRIIKTQKPKEQVATQPENASNQSTSNTTSEPAQSTGSVQGVTGVIGSGNVGVGGVVLNASGSGLATEDTVSKIYALLSVKRSGTDNSQDSRIDAIKKAIATKEAEERAALEAARKKAAEEKKATEEAAKKAAAEKKATEEVKKKPVEEKKGVEEVKKKVAEEKKVAEAVRKQSPPIPKAPSKKVAKDTIQNLFASAHKSYGEISASNKVFREHGFSATSGIITQQTKGLMARVDEVLKNGFDTHGHMHPRNSMYSATDLASMANIRAQNKSYDSDVLVTPDYIYKLEGLSKVSVEQLTNLYNLFNQFESSHMNAALLNKAKESLVYEFAKNNGISYSKNTYDAAGNLTDITNQEKMLQKESLELLKEFVSVLRNNKHNTGEEYSAWQNKKNSLLERMKKDEMLNSLMLSSAHDKEVERTRSSANYDKVRSGTLIQEAIDYDFDLSLFIQQFKDYFDAINKLGESVQPNSALAKIKQYVQELGNLDVNSNEYKELISNIKTLSLTVFDKNPDRQIDRRFLPQLASISATDKSGAIRKVLLREKLKNALGDSVSEDYLNAAKTPVEKSIGKDINVFWNSIKDSYTEIQAANRMFREQKFEIHKSIVKGISTGTYGHTTGSRIGVFGLGGHTHPTNSLYSSEDISSIANRRGSNTSYNTDMLITPDYVYELTGLKNVSKSALEELSRQFKYVETGLVNINGKSFSQSLQTQIKEALLHNFANQNKVQFSQNRITSDGTLFNVTDKTNIIGQEIVNRIISAVKNGIEKMNASQLTNGIDDMVLNYALDHESENKQKDAIEGKIFKHGSMLQSAVDQNADLRYFYDDLIKLLQYIEKSGRQIPDDSVLGRIKNAVSVSAQSNKEEVMNYLRGDLIEFFGYHENAPVDKRIKNDFDAKYHPYQSFVFQEDIGNELDEFANMTLNELKAELSRLEGLRDEGTVDPRFATAEKQDVIIGLLKNGVAIAGKGSNVSSTSQKTSGEKKGPERASKGQTIDNARKEIDSATGAASTTVKDTGEIITKTAQKCGAEILNITKTVKNGVESTTASINNDYEVAMKKTNEQIKAKGQRGLFGAPYDPNVNVETTDAQAALNKYIETYNKLEGLINKFKNLNLSTASGKNDASKLQVEIDIAQKDLDYFEDKLISVAANTEKFLGGKEAFSIMDTGALDQTGMSLKLLAQQSENAMVAFNGLYNDGTKLLYDVFDPATSTFKRYSLEVDKATGYVRKMETAQTGLVNAFQNVNKIQRQSADLEGIEGINANSNLVKQYNEARQKLDQAVNDSWTKARSENRLISLDEQKEIYAMSNEVLRLGKRILSTANSFKVFKAEGGQTFEVVKNGAESLETSMRRLAGEQALDDKMSIGNIAYNDATKKLSYDLTDLDGNIHKVTMSYVEMFNQVKITSNNSVAAMDKVSAAIREDMVIIDDAVGAGLIDTRTDKYVEYTNELKAMFDYKEKLEASDDKLTQNDIDNLNMRKAAVKALGDELVATAKKNAASMGQGSKAIQNEVNKRNTIDVGVGNFSALSNTKQYQSYLTVYQAMIDKQEEFRQNGILAGESEQNQLARMAKEVENARIKFEQLANASAQFNAKIGDSGQVKILPKDFSYGNLEQEMKQFVLSQNNLTQSQKEMIESTWTFKNAQDGATYSVRVGKDQVASMSVIFDEGTRRIGQYTVETKKYKTGMEKFMDSLKNKWQELARYLATFGSFYQVINLLRQGITYVREIDSALTELKKVTDETEESYDRFLDTASKTASKVGSTIKEIVSSTADWSRLGYGMEEAHQLAESTSVLLNVSEFQSIEEATSALTSTLQAFGYTASQSMNVVDVLNEVGKVVARR